MGNGLSPDRIQIFVNPNTSRDTVAYSTLPGIKGRTIKKPFLADDRKGPDRTARRSTVMLATALVRG
jgi:hypothetical protein